MSLVLVEYPVTGRGEFPLDMLRYDSSWPATQDDVAKITRTLDVMVPPGEVTVRLRRWVNERDHRRGEFVMSTARWASFGWTADPRTRLEVNV